MTFIDDHSHFTWVFLIFDESEVTSTFGDFYHTIETQFNTKITILQSSYPPKALPTKVLMSTRPQQNGVAEHKTCHLLEVACSLMLSTSVPSYIWADIVLTVAHLQMSSRVLHL